MQNSQIVVGIDIGAYEIRGVVGSISEGDSFEILGFAKVFSSGVYNGSISNINKLSEDIGSIINKLENQSEISINSVKIGISDCKISTENHIVSLIRESSDNEVSTDDILSLKNDIQRTLLPAGKSIIDVVPQSYTLDYKKKIKDPVGMRGVRLEGEFKIFTIDSEVLKSIDKAISKIGKKMVSVCVSSLTTSIVSLYEDEKDAGVCLIDFGKDTTQLAIFIDSVLVHFVTLPIGSGLINKDLKHAFFLLSTQAEELKIKLSDILLSDDVTSKHVEISNFSNRVPKAFPLNIISEVVKARFEEIVKVVGSEINKFCKTKDIAINNLSAGIVLYGGGCKLKNSVSKFEEIIGLEARMAKLIQNIEISNNAAKNFDYYNFIAPIGIAINSYKSIDYRDNLHKIEFSKPIKQKPADVSTKVGKKIWNIWAKTKKLLIDEDTE